MTVVYKSGRKHSDADCLSRAPVETPSGSSDDEDDECFLGAVNTDDMARRQRDDPELRALIEHLEGRGGAVPRVFSRALPTFVHPTRCTLQGELRRQQHTTAAATPAIGRTTAYHPQTNGLTERLNKTIADMISMYVDVEHKTWDEVLPYVTFAYNTAVQETTGVTPFQLVHGRKVTTMLDAMLPHEPADDGSDDAQVVAQRAEEVRQLARLRIQAQQRVDTGRYNLRRRDVHFQPGDRVWVWTPIRRRGLSEKLLKRYFGPYKVLRRLGDLNYEVMPDGTRTSSRRPPRPEVVHVVRLKPYYAR
ncbi:uncharacterized protein ISCGN_022801 [Ixodes scapularis]